MLKMLHKMKPLIIVLVVIVIAYLIYRYWGQSLMSSSKPTGYPESADRPTNYENYSEQAPANDNTIRASGKMTKKPTGNQDPIMKKQQYTGADITEGFSNNMVGGNTTEYMSQDPSIQEQRVAMGFPKDTLSADELLPNDPNSAWAASNPDGSGSLKDRAFLQAGYNIGINTVGQTLRNANLQLRSEPPCPTVRVSPFLNSTIEPDVSRRPFEIGSC